MNKTPWYPASVKPIRPGWYEVRGCKGVVCNGVHWWTGIAWTYKSYPAVSLPWRGVMK